MTKLMLTRPVDPRPEMIGSGSKKIRTHVGYGPFSEPGNSNRIT
ncbi:hypothetical protein C943_00274 [Mariniradius saccharolyticus AK6]|uniref:Uncharacterized protein n=1 Tax=Mariniradius saccharolyticus AK6 TaxID=1239962 RepID=M7XWW4_9BACT|nr:hypothetical protein C943_00274 [Mariniradius saccharolyticus AK6]